MKNTNYKRKTKRYTKKPSTTVTKAVKYELNKNLETKYWEGVLFEYNPVASAGVLVDADGNNVSLLSSYRNGVSIPSQSIIRGIGSNQYIGDRISLTYVILHFAIDYSPSTDVTNVVTLYLLQSKGLFNFNPLSAANQFSENGDILAPLSFPDRDYDDRFRVIAKKAVRLNAADSNIHIGTMKVKSSRLTNVHFTSTTGDVESNQLNLCMISDSVVVPHPAIRAVWRVYYKDA